MDNKKSVFTSCDSDSDKLGRFIGGGSVAIVSSVIAGVFALLWTVIMTRMLGKDDFGILGPYLKMFWILTMLTSFGLPPTLMTMVSQNHIKDFPASKRIAAEGNRLLFIIGAIFCILPALTAVAAKLTGSLTSLAFALILIMAAAVISRQMFLGVHASMTGIQRMDLVGFISIAFAFTLPVSSLLFLMISQNIAHGQLLKELRIISGAAGIGVSSIISWSLALIVTRRAAIKPADLYNWKNTSPAESKAILKFGLVTFIAIFAFTLVQLLPEVWFSYVMVHTLRWFSPEFAGVFSAASTYAMAPALIIGITFALIPAMSEADEHGNKPLMNQYFNVSLRYCFSLIAMITALYASAAGPLVSALTGGNYSAAQMHNITFNLEIYAGVTNLFFLLFSMIVGLKKPAVVAAVSSVIVVLQIIGMSIAGKLTQDINTVAWSMITVILIGILSLLVYLIKGIGLKLNFAIFIVPLASAAIAWAAAIPLPKSGLSLLATFPLVPFVFFLATGMLGGITCEDLNIIRQTLASLRLGFLTPVIGLLEKLFSISPLYKKS